MEQNGRTYGRAVYAVIAALTVFWPTLIASTATMTNIPTWYEGIQKPWFTPPNWVFGPVWTLLYTALTISFHRILCTHPATPGRRAAIIIFVVQIVLNALWSVAFFGLRSPGLGLIVIALLWASIVVNALAFRRIDRPSSWTFAPYLAWVSFAALLNYAIFMLN